MNSFYISPDLENGIHVGFRIIFVVSCLLNLLCFVCLLKKTPLHQSTFRNYLIFIQILLILNDISIDVLFEPIPLFPAYAGYCVGVLCASGVPLQYSLATAILLLSNVGVSIVVCCLYRHQTILLSSSIFKLHKKTLTILRTVLFVLFSLPGAILFIPLNSGQTDQLIEKFTPDISWIKYRGTYIMYERTNFIVGIFIFLVAYRNSPTSLKRHRKSIHVFFIQVELSNQNTFAIGMTNRHEPLLNLHALSLVRQTREHANREEARADLPSLVCNHSEQIGIPITLLITPGLIMLTGLIFELVPFEVCLAAYFMVPLHPIGHNIILLAVTPSYRTFVGHLISGGACGMRRAKPPSASVRFVSIKSVAF